MAPSRVPSSDLWCRTTPFDIKLRNFWPESHGIYFSVLNPLKSEASDGNIICIPFGVGEDRGDYKRIGVHKSGRRLIA